MSKNFLFLLKYNKETGKTIIFERRGFPSWMSVQHSFGYNAYPIVDRLFDIVFIMPGPHTMWKAVLYAYKNNIDIPISMSSNDWYLLAEKFIFSGQGYYMSTSNGKWCILDSYERDFHDDNILETSKTCLFSNRIKFEII